MRRLGGTSILATAMVLWAAASAAAVSPKTYIVQLHAAPLASYTGGHSGLPATSPKATGARKLNTRSSAAVAYSSYLAGRQRAALAAVPGSAPKIDYDYRVAFAGFAAEMTSGQAAALRKAPEVAHVWADAKAKPQSTPDPADAAQVDAALGGPSGFGDSAAYLGLPFGLWSEHGVATASGADVVVGVIDTGITPQHPSFADHAAGNYIGPDYGPPPASFAGACDTGSDPLGFACNNKLIGARYYVTGFGLDHVAAGSFISPRDDDGHGTHTASTAAGNFGVDPSIRGNDLGVDLISGIAPRALVAAYKFCWVGGDVADGCSNADAVAAINRAVADGVDVINYSVGGSTSNLIDAVEYAFLGASDAGVFVANSAGNDGPGEGTVGTPTTVPWLTSVAADNPARTFEATVHVTPSSGPAFDVTGASVTQALPAAPVVDAATSGLPGSAAGDAERGFEGTLDPAKVTGKIVLCLRGVSDRIAKSKAVKDAGGVGMILYNPNPGQDTDTDIHYVPSVHVSNADGLKVKAAIAAGPTNAVGLNAGHAALGTPRVLAAFSSRGPQEAVPDIPKPDVTAPGVNILAGNTPNPAPATGLPPGELFQSISGTSMASPHVAGAGALLTQEHPDWTPAEMKSALMLTANPYLKAVDGTSPATPFDAGSGESDITRAAHPGLVLDENTNDYIRYVDSQDPTVFGDGQEPIEPADLNLAALSVGQLPGTFATTRRVTSVDAAARSWTATVDVPGFSGSVTPASFTIQPGATQSLAIALQRTNAPTKAYTYGQITLTSGTTTLHMPVSLRPIAIAAPAKQAITTRRSLGRATIDVQAGYTGQLSGLGYGLAAPDTQPRQSITTDPTGVPDPTNRSRSNRFFDVRVPRRAQLLSGRISNADGDADPNTDLDLYLYYDANHDGAFTDDELLDQSASAIADEGIDVTFPAAGRYRFVVVGFTTRSPSRYDFSQWIVADDTPDRLSLLHPSLAVDGDPFDVTVGQTVHPFLDYAGLLRPALYLGVATFHDAARPTDANRQATTIVEVTRTR
jgi:subtilisin family serine protease